MKVTYYASSTILVEADGVKVLMDPWLEDGEYYGSWAHYPPVEVDYSIFDDVDYIYITHIHPDHMSRKTLAKLNKSIPILIHNYDAKFLKRNLEFCGYAVEELPNGHTKNLSDDFRLTVYAADDCDPELCGAFFKCAPLHGRSGSTQVDSLCVLEHGEQVMVNTNDCPFGLTQPLLPKIRERHGNIAMLLTGYTGAGPYPQCFSAMSKIDVEKAAKAKLDQFHQQGLNFIKALNPRYVLPFAGQYTLAGELACLNDLRGVSELEEAKAFFESQLKGNATEIILLDRSGSIDLTTGSVEGRYEPSSKVAKDDYVRNVLAARKFDFDDDNDPDAAELVELAKAAAARAEKKRVEMDVQSETAVYVRLNASLLAKVSLLGEALVIVKDEEKREAPFVLMSVQPKLLRRILKGPQFAHWNNATIGSHVQFERSPNVYESEVYDVMNYFHA